MAYVFPTEAINQPWWSDFSKKHLVYLTKNSHSVEEMCRIIKEVKPDITHTHFEGYDTSVYKAVRRLNLDVKQVWHLHDVLNYHRNPLKALYQVFGFFRHYSWYSNGVSAIGVSTQIFNFVNRYKTILSNGFAHGCVIPNGVDLNRIHPREDFYRHEKFTFLAFGGRNVQKRIDLLVKAAEILVKEENIELIITEGTDTREVVNAIFNNNVPSWCRIVPQQDNVSELMDKADCFVSTAVAEGHSYAVCEASIYGLPIIQSDVPGNMWNANNPSAFVFVSENIQDLVKTMKEVINTSDEQLMLACLNTQRNNRDLYSIDKWAEKIIGFYSNIS